MGSLVPLSLPHRTMLEHFEWNAAFDGSTQPPERISRHVANQQISKEEAEGANLFTVYTVWFHGMSCLRRGLWAPTAVTRSVTLVAHETPLDEGHADFSESVKLEALGALSAERPDIAARYINTRVSAAPEQAFGRFEAAWTVPRPLGYLHNTISALALLGLIVSTAVLWTTRRSPGARAHNAHPPPTPPTPD